MKRIFVTGALAALLATAAATPVASNNPWLKRNNDARGPLGTAIRGPAPAGANFKPVQPQAF